MTYHLTAAPRPFSYNPPKEPYISILYEDEDMLVLDKPAGLLTVAGKLKEHSDCLESRALEHRPDARVVHRLDMDTSGVIILALNKPALARLSMQFEKRQTTKLYIAEIFGFPEKNKGTVDLPLICDWPNRPKQMVDHERGKKAVTDWEVLDRNKNKNCTRVKLMPITGRSHQLRLHMVTLGHPVLGDNIYAHDEAFMASPRLMLHAQYLAIRHPVSNKKLEFESLAPF
ncbi:MAG: pseudouridine synthase [Methyloligellaceae bacterium]